MRQVASIGDQREPGAGDPPRELMSVGRRNHRIRFSPDDQSGRSNPVNPLFETLVRDRPNNFPGADL